MVSPHCFYLWTVSIKPLLSQPIESHTTNLTPPLSIEVSVPARKVSGHIFVC